MELSDYQVLVSLLGLPSLIDLDISVDPVTPMNQGNRALIGKDAALELQLLRVRWGWIANYYGPDLQYDNECCMSEVMDWYNDAVDFQQMWGGYNTPLDVALAITKIEAEIAGNASAGAP